MRSGCTTCTATSMSGSMVGTNGSTTGASFAAAHGGTRPDSSAPPFATRPTQITAPRTAASASPANGPSPSRRPDRPHRRRPPRRPRPPARRKRRWSPGRAGKVVSTGEGPGPLPPTRDRSCLFGLPLLSPQLPHPIPRSDAHRILAQGGATSMFWRTTIVALALSLAFGASPARSELISGSSGLNGLGAFTGTFYYSASSAGEATLKIELTNVSPGGTGYLTAFVFNNPKG